MTNRLLGGCSILHTNWKALQVLSSLADLFPCKCKYIFNFLNETVDSCVLSIDLVYKDSLDTLLNRLYNIYIVNMPYYYPILQNKDKTQSQQ